MLKIRLQRVGRKNDPSFRVVVTDSRRGPKSADYVELLGSYNPRQKTKAFKADRIKHWIDMGAQVSGTMNNLLINEKIITGKKVNVLGKKTPIVKEVTEEEAAKEADAPTEEATTEASTDDAHAEAEVPAEEAPKEEEKKEEVKEEPEETPKEEPKEEQKEEKEEDKKEA